MNKQQAADYLGVSTRAIERYTAKGKLTPEYENLKGGQRIAVYDEKQLAQIKSEMDAPASPKPSSTVARRDTPDTSDRGDTTQALERRRGDIADFLKLIAQTVKEARTGDDARPVPTLSLGDKLVLSLKESAALAGISRDRLLTAIESGALKASKDTLGRGWRIKRSDLDTYVQRI